MGPPELNEDVTVEILLRIPPDEPADLVRASVVCKLWHRVVSDSAFLRRYRTFHRGAPLLGFFYYDRFPGFFPGFVSTTAVSSPLKPRNRDYPRWVPDCRHGRVLISNCETKKFAVWDPFSKYWEELQGPRRWYGSYSAVVLCPVADCDHRSCCGGPFHVVFVGVDNSDYTTVQASVYSSVSRAWYTPASASIDRTHCFFERNRAALIADEIYYIVDHGRKILKYDLVKHQLSLIGMPYHYKNAPVLMQNEDGSLGIAGVSDSRLYLWFTMLSADGVTGWVQQRVIKLEEILPVDIISDQANVTGFAEGVKVFFISTNAGAFTFELKSGRVRKVAKPRDYRAVSPFISFFTPDRACSKWTK